MFRVRNQGHPENRSFSDLMDCVCGGGGGEFRTLPNQLRPLRMPGLDFSRFLFACLFFESQFLCAALVVLELSL